MKYSISKKNILKHLGFSGFIILVFICYILYLLFFETKNIQNALIVTLVLVAVQLLVVGVHIIDYYYNSTRESIEIDSDKITIINKGVVKIIMKEEVKEAIVYAAPSINRGSVGHVLPHESLYYVDIKYNNSNSIIITSLSDYDLLENLKKEPILEGKIRPYKRGLTGRGSLMNLIFWDNWDV